MEYYTFTENDEERVSRNHHVKNTWVKERYESDEEDGEVNKLILKEDEETKDMVTSPSGERMMLTSKVRYLTYGALKHDTAASAASGGGGRALPHPSNKYNRGHPKYYRCRG
ncbi:putative rapid ALkalinization Factor [Arabidopsis thaliana]|uniref:Uncharacterized protein n=4 Tax=Arabidopsis TaxID=3701 RepID=Q8LEX6_ARATH|nr:unknown [Arabidopsis thaliana]KAG7615884.1 Rapid ALkalinization Factor [Arabidopsis thaliana x Arabidopsis arenosa]KAG7620376.1 Rapid ALkalinization Factor [Arabidopsis suecica]OAO97979.1 hypothetical protein AXX17_AT4G16040 [Arabidopsis thaliana]CAA0395159.1 unnamed protein product [Arabidopsis thaliana]